MLNLNEIRAQVKSANLSRTTPTPHTPLGINEAYRQIKALGWACHNSEVHPTDRVPVFRLGNAMLRRNRRHSSDWIIDVAGGTFEASGDLEELTAKVTELDSETTPTPPDPAAEIITELVAQHPNLRKWAERGLALYRDGDAMAERIARYDTRITTETGHYECDCPARAPRVSSGNVLHIDTLFNGNGCKHAISLYIDTMLKHEAQVVADRKQADRRSRRTYRGHRPGHTFDTVPGDGGVSDQDLEGPLPPETYRRQCQTFINAGDTASLVQTVETMRATLPRLSNGAERQMRAAIDWAVKWGALDAPDGYEWDGDSLVEVHKPTTPAQPVTVAAQRAAARASLGNALKPDPANRRGGQRFQFTGRPPRD